MAQKEKIHIYVDSEILEKFKEFVFAKYGTLHAYLGEELTKAMDYYLSHAVDAHTQENEHIISKPNKRHIKLLTWLAKTSQYEITHSEIESYITSEFGVDKRTKKKYINEFLIRFGFIEQKKALFGKNVIYTVNFEKIYNYLKRFLKDDELKKMGITKIKSVVEVEAEDTKTSKEEIKAFAAQRYEAGDSLDEITQRLADFGVVLEKRAVRNMIRKAYRGDGHV